MKGAIEVEYKDGNVFLKNISPYMVEIYLIPVKPKRKVLCECILYPDSFKVYNRVTDFDITKYYFRFVKQS